MSSLKLNNIYHTVQGEGAHWGRRALFVRLPFCNLDCSWCDTSFNTFFETSLEKIDEVIDSEPTRFAVVTGGEPTMNKIFPTIVDHLRKRGFTVAVETNGMFPVYDSVNWVTVSPKKWKNNHYEVHPKTYEMASEFKYVVDHEFDWDILKRHDERPTGALLWLSPEYNQFELNTSAILKFVADNPKWRLNLQTHKWICID